MTAHTTGPALEVGVAPTEGTWIAAVDVAYGATRSVAACVVFEDWSAPAAMREHVVFSSSAAPYVPGRFFERELPYVLRVLAELPRSPQCLVVDGFVWLEDERPGLGGHAWNALGQKVVVVGVAKTAFKSASHCVPVTRGASKSPLYVTAAGAPVEEAADWVRRMHGEHRTPTLLRRVDQLSRELATPMVER